MYHDNSHWEKTLQCKENKKLGYQNRKGLVNQLLFINACLLVEKSCGWYQIQRR